MINAARDLVVSRFTVLQREREGEAELWQGKAQAFRNLYGFPIRTRILSACTCSLRHVPAKLPRRKSGPDYQFDDEVRLEHYRLQKISEESISLAEGTARALDGPKERGSGVSREVAVPLSRGDTCPLYERRALPGCR